MHGGRDRSVSHRLLASVRSVFETSRDAQHLPSVAFGCSSTNFIHNRNIEVETLAVSPENNIMGMFAMT